MNFCCFGWLRRLRMCIETFLVPQLNEKENFNEKCRSNSVYFARCFDIFAKLYRWRLAEENMTFKRIIGTMNDKTTITKRRKKWCYQVFFVVEDSLIESQWKFSPNKRCEERTWHCFQRLKMINNEFDNRLKLLWVPKKEKGRKLSISLRPMRSTYVSRRNSDRCWWNVHCDGDPFLFRNDLGDFIYCRSKNFHSAGFFNKNTTDINAFEVILRFIRRHRKRNWKTKTNNEIKSVVINVFLCVTIESRVERWRCDSKTIFFSFSNRNSTSFLLGFFTVAELVNHHEEFQLFDSTILVQSSNFDKYHVKY